MEVQRGKIVIVEDDLDAQEALTRVLRGLGYEVWPAGNGELALLLIERHKPDLICLDLSLPSISGFDVCEAVKSNRDTALSRVLVLTGRESPQDRAIAEALGADEYLTKPFSMGILTSLVERLTCQTQEPIQLQPKVQQ